MFRILNGVEQPLIEPEILIHYGRDYWDMMKRSDVLKDIRLNTDKETGLPDYPEHLVSLAFQDKVLLNIPKLCDTYDC
jgi:hypothetical protein